MQRSAWMRVLPLLVSICVCMENSHSPTHRKCIYARSCGPRAYTRRYMHPRDRCGPWRMCLKLDFDIDRFIFEIENHPAIWNMKCDEFSDRAQKVKQCSVLHDHHRERRINESRRAWIYKTHLPRVNTQKTRTMMPICIPAGTRVRSCVDTQYTAWCGAVWKSPYTSETEFVELLKKKAPCILL